MSGISSPVHSPVVESVHSPLGRPSNNPPSGYDWLKVDGDYIKVDGDLVAVKKEG